MFKKKTKKKVLKEKVGPLPPTPIIEPTKTYQCRGCKTQFPALDGVCKDCGRTDAFRIK